MKLTQSKIPQLKHPGGGNRAMIFWDDSLPGFGVRVYPSGRRSYVIIYRTENGLKRWLTVGPCNVLTLAEARDAARRLFASIIEGEDPLEDRNKKRSGDTVADLCTAYLNRHAKAHKKTWDEDESRINRHILPIWGAKAANSITTDQVAKLHSKIGSKTPYEANRTLQLVKTIWNLGQKWGYVHSDTKNPTNGVQKFKEKKRDRWVTPQELPKVTKAIESESNPYLRAAFWLYLLTGVRKSELLNATWADVDLARKELKIPETKAGRIHYVPLSSPAVELLRTLPRVQGNPYVLPGIVDGRPLVNIDKPWRRIRKAAGIEDVRLHDLRRTVGSWMAADGASLVVIGKALDHSNPQTTQIYARLGQDPVRDALERHGTKIMGAVEGQGQTASVQRLPVRKK